MTEILTLLSMAAFTGLLAGFLAGLFGIGGGIIVVPALFQVFQMSGASRETAIAMSVATSLACILPTSIASIRAHHRLQNIDWPTLRTSIPFLVVGAILGSSIVTQFSGIWLNWVFSALLVGVAIITARRAAKCSDDSPAPVRRRLSAWLMHLLVFLIAFFSSLAGVGGGALGGPMLINLGYPAHRAVGTAAGFGLAIATPAVLSIFLLGNTPIDAPPGSVSLINLPALLVIMLCSVLMAPVGAKTGKRMSDCRLASWLVVLLGVIALKMLLTGL